MHYGGGNMAGYSPLDFEHTVPDWDSLMRLGFTGILDRIGRDHAKLAEEGILTEKQEAFYRGVVIEYRAILSFIGRLEDYARSRKHEKAASVAACMNHLRTGAPQDSYDAMQMIYLYFMISESVDHYQVRSLGFGLDATLYPFYKADIESGRMTEDEFSERLSYFLMQWSAIGNYWGQPFYLGGTNVDGSTRVNELSYLILKVYRELGIYNPKIQIKASELTPKPFLMEALDMIRSGSSSIVFCNENHIARAIMARGGTYEDACDAVISGCYEYNKKINSLNVSNIYPNLVKPIQFVFDNGYDRMSGLQVGPKTGDVADFTEFRQFYEAYLTQVRAIFTEILDAVKLIENCSGEINPSLLFSATIPKCSAALRDALDGGVENDCAIILGGIGSATDALMAVYELVYERKVTTLTELRDALRNNWEGYEKLRKIALNLKHKYGNGDRMADDYAAAILKCVGVDIAGGRTTAHGGRVIVDGHSARAFIILGERTLATPDGRKAGEEISKNISPAQGVDRKGITALIRSATHLDNGLLTLGGCLDAMLHPSAVQGAEGLEAFYGTLLTFLKEGGPSIHFNIFDPQVLRDAQQNPDKYKSLQIRVCGWNSLWNNMPKSEQDEYIKRAENIQ